MTPHALVAALGIYAGAFAVGAVSSVVPFVSIDVFVVGITVAVGAPRALPAIVLAAAGQLVGKLPIYFATRGATARSERALRLRARFARWQHAPHAVLASGALLGLPPFSIVATAAGALAIRTRAFCAIVLAGRALRFAAVVALAAAWR